MSGHRVTSEERNNIALQGLTPWSMSMMTLWSSVSFMTPKDHVDQRREASVSNNELDYLFYRHIL
jgi:hypothetical protein